AGVAPFAAPLLDRRARPPREAQIGARASPAVTGGKQRRIGELGLEDVEVVLGREAQERHLVAITERVRGRSDLTNSHESARVVPCYLCQERLGHVQRVRIPALVLSNAVERVPP